MATTLKAKWMCEMCGDILDTEDEAYDCCRPQVKEVYVCPVCGDWHKYMDVAIDCCGYDQDAPSPSPPPSAEELEAMGQMRLIS